MEASAGTRVARKARTSTSSGSTCSACMPTKCGMRRSPPTVLHPVTAIVGPESSKPTVCAPTIPLNVPSFIESSCADVGDVINAPIPTPASDTTEPIRSAHRVAGSANGVRSTSTVSTSEPVHSRPIETPMTLNTVESNGVITLKWLPRPRTTCMTIRACSTTNTAAMPTEIRWASRLPTCSNEISHAQVTP